MFSCRGASKRSVIKAIIYNTDLGELQLISEVFTVFIYAYEQSTVISNTDQYVSVIVISPFESSCVSSCCVLSVICPRRVYAHEFEP